MRSCFAVFIRVSLYVHYVTIIVTCMPSKQISLSHVEQTAYFLSLRLGKRIINTDFISSHLDISKNYAKDLLYSLAKKGAAVKLAKGMYLPVHPEILYGRKSFSEDPFLIIDELMSELKRSYYVAYISAAHVHGIAHQLPFSLHVAVKRRRRGIKASGISIRFVTVKQERFFGIEEMKFGDRKAKVSDLEKTILDCLERPDLCGSIGDAAMMIYDARERIEWKKLVNYSKIFNNGALVQRLGYILEKLAHQGLNVDKGVINSLQKALGRKFAYPLDPSMPKEGRLNRNWMIVENLKIVK